jgi:hypothetical protein
MNAFRNIRALILFGLLAVPALSLGPAPAQAGGLHKLHSPKVHSVYPSYFHHAHYCPNVYQPIVKYVVRPYSYPVTLVDCYGRPYVVWQTAYRTVPATYYPY